MKIKDKIKMFISFDEQNVNTIKHLMTFNDIFCIVFEFCLHLVLNQTLTAIQFTHKTHNQFVWHYCCGHTLSTQLRITVKNSPLFEVDFLWIDTCVSACIIKYLCAFAPVFYLFYCPLFLSNNHLNRYLIFGCIWDQKKY